MKPKVHAPQVVPPTGTGSPGLDIVVPFTTRQLTRAALAAAGRFSAGLLPLIRMVHAHVVAFPLELEAAPISVATLRNQFSGLADGFGAHVQVCFSRDRNEGLLYLLSPQSVIVIAARRHWWRRWWPSGEERLARWLRRRGYFVVLEFVEKNNA